MNWVLAGQTNMLGRRLATGLTSRATPIAPPPPPPPFTPASLFAAGEQGVWYDPSDLTTMFEDSAGTTAVHTPGNGTADSPVGRILDKSGRGNHATQSTSTARPTLSAKYNLLTYTEQFDNAAWTKGATSITANATTDPLGGNTADKLVEDTSSGIHYVRQVSSVSSGTKYTLSIYVKPAGRNWIALTWNNGPGYYFDCQNGVIGSSFTGSGTASNPTIANAGNGWYRCTVDITSGGTGGGLDVFLANADNSASYIGNGTSGVFLWGADVRVSNDGVGIPAYQRVADANTYNSTGFPYYLAGDGVNKMIATGSINFSSTDKATVFASTRKFGAGGFQCIAEFSADSTANNGAFSLFTFGSSSFFPILRGTAFIEASTSASYPSPTTTIVTISDDLAQSTRAAEMTARVNGSANTLTYGGAADAGTGNFGNYPLYLLNRTGASNYFNGRLYGLIIRGASCTATEITNTETWLNGITKAY